MVKIPRKPVINGKTPKMVREYPEKWPLSIAKRFYKSFAKVFLSKRRKKNII